MTEVKLFTYSYLDPQMVGGTPMLRNPYLAGEVLNAGADSVTSKATTAPHHTQVARLQIEPGESVCVEVTPEGHPIRLATQASPTVTGDVLIQMGSGWTVSVVAWASPAEVTALAWEVIDRLDNPGKVTP